MKVYAVTKGEYSDFCVDEIFSTKEKAEKYQAAHPETNVDIEEYEVDACVTECEVYYGLEVTLFKNEYHGCGPIRDTKPIQEKLYDCSVRPYKRFTMPVTRYYEYGSKVAQKIAQDAWAKYRYEHNITE